jgi:hypothetical protein
VIAGNRGQGVIEDRNDKSDYTLQKSYKRSSLPVPKEVTMRHLIWIAVVAAFTQLVPLAYAQSDTGTKGGTYNAGPSGGPPPAFSTDKLNPTNCGTPDDPKPCGSARRALKTHSVPKPSSG